MLFTSRSYAIGMAHFQISGGYRTLLILLICYVLAASSLIGLVIYGQGWPLPRDVAQAMYLFTLVIETIVLTAVGALRVGSCIRLDVSSGMIESHRLMPIAPWRAIMGYLSGTTVQVLVITAVNLLVLVFLAPMAGMSYQELVMAQFVLAFFAIFTWMFAVLGSLMVRQMLPLMILGFVFGTIGSMALRAYGILPGFSVLASPFFGETVFVMTRRMLSAREAYGLGLFAQIAFASLFFVGACRRYRGSYATTFNVWQALGVGLIWNLLSIVAIREWETFLSAFRMFRIEQPGKSAQIIATIVVSALLAMIPVHSLSEWVRRRDLPLGLIGAVLAAAAVIAASPALAAGFQTKLIVITVLVLWAHAVTVYTTERSLKIFTPLTAGVLMFALLFTLWVGPLLLEVLRWNFDPVERVRMGDHELGLLGTLSPIGLLATQWLQDKPPTPLPGLAVQWLMPIWIVAFGRWLDRRNSRPRLGALSPA